MALEFYNITDVNRQRLLFSIDNKQLDLIDDVFSDLRKQVGVTIDLYGNSRIYKDHIDLLMDIIKTKIDIKKASLKNQTLLHFIKELSKADVGFLVSGD